MAVPGRIDAVDGGQQTAAGGHEPGAPSQELDQIERSRHGAAVHIESRNEVEGAGGQLLASHIEDDAVNPLPQTAPVGLGLQTRDRGRGQVDTGDLPTPLGEPDGVGALPTSQVEGAPRLPGGGELRQPIVGLLGPQPIDGGVTRFPMLLTLIHGGDARSPSRETPT